MEEATLDDLATHREHATPIMKQYYEIKKKYKKHVLLFRMGDFYEVFFEDALTASRILNITLTRRGKIAERPIPMAGIPHHSAANYLDRLTGAGLKAAVCEQVQDAREARGIVQRAVTQVVSPGIPFDLDQSDAREHYYIAAAIRQKNHFYLAIIDFTTGEFNGVRLPHRQQFVETLKAYNPKEVITFPGQWKPFPEMASLPLTHLAPEYFDPRHTHLYIEKIIPGHRQDKILSLSPDILAPVGALAYYLHTTRPFHDSPNKYFHLAPFRMLSEEGRMKVTLTTLTGLEILPTNRDNYSLSLLGMLDKCKTGMGSRVLKRMILSPLNDYHAIQHRLNLVEFFVTRHSRLNAMRATMSDVRDLERILAKTAGGKIHAGDFHNMARTIRAWQALPLSDLPPRVLSQLGEESQKNLNALAVHIVKYINDEPGACLEKGNLIKPGADSRRDKLAKMADNVQAELEKLEESYRLLTDIPKLRIKSNNISGYFIEVSKSHINKVPPDFVRWQTLTNSERYTSKKLSLFEEQLNSSREKLNILEREILEQQIHMVEACSPDIQALASFLGHLDAWLALAFVSQQESFVRPNILPDDQPREISYEGLRHPLLQNLSRDEFVPHNITLASPVLFGLITGPNMAGKTTVMREVALTQVLAQMGCFVPAESARISLCDHLFSRLGASDDILRGQSTFMVEMSETAEILRHATEKSLIILDEIGRGTSTYDGLSIAWALTEYLVREMGALTLFATHYHELIEQVDNLPGAKNFTVETYNDGDDIKFLYRLIERGATQSFGIHVAKLAGLPPSLLERAKHILQSLESELSQTSPAPTTTGEPLPNPGARRIAESLQEMNPLHMTPLQALGKLEEFKRMLADPNASPPPQ